MINEKYLLGVYKREGPVFVKGKGSFLWDEKGRKYLDLFPGWGVGILGHAHPDIAAVIAAQARKLVFLPNNLHHQWQAPLAERIVTASFNARVFFANSGAEAVEGALKFSRLYGRGKRYEVITMKDSFHGRTLAAASLTGQKKYKEPFKPLVPGIKEARFNDFNDFKKKVTKKTVAVLMELIQGEGGVNVACKEYVSKVNAYCKKHNILFIVDEVQTGMGRTAKMFCYQHYGITPDIMILAKGLGAGVPISAFCVKKSIAGIMKPGHHASTFGGNPLATRASLEVFAVIRRSRLLARAKTLGAYLSKRLTALQAQHPVIKEVRGKGLMVGVELTHAAYPVFRQALRRHLIINVTHDTVLRIMPALTVTKKEIDTGLKIIEDILKKIEARNPKSETNSKF